MRDERKEQVDEANTMSTTSLINDLRLDFSHHTRMTVSPVCLESLTVPRWEVTVVSYSSLVRPHIAGRSERLPHSVHGLTCPAA